MIRLNDELLRLFGASWRQLPANFAQRRKQLHRKGLRVLLRRQHWMWHGLLRSFGEPGREGVPTPPRLRPRLLVSGGPPWRSSTAVPFWGWKDPRNTLTLRLWLDLFPEARVIHVIRSGIDVALSLHRRAAQRGVGTPECSDPAYCFQLWERYAQEGCAWRTLPESRYLEVYYEELLREPRAQLLEMLRFVGSSPDTDCKPALALCTQRPTQPAPPEQGRLERLAANSQWFAELGYTQPSTRRARH